MWELGNMWGEGNKINNGVPMASSSYLSIMHEIHVLLVDHEPDSVLNIAKMLEMCQYRVTLVELASAAITMLLSGKVKFDVVLANINSPDLHGFKLLQQAVNMAIPVVLMSCDDNIFVAMRAIESGATLYVQKPVTMDVIRCLWQHVLKDKSQAMKEREKILAAGNGGRAGIEVVMQENPNDVDNKGKSKRKARGRKEDGYDSESTGNHNSRVRRKVCTEWTQELHEKFMAAVRQLGEGRCFPKEILDLMGVPGLTRMQVASHLQKCRNDNWRPPEERKSSSLSIQLVSSDTDGGALPKPRRFGSMPRLVKGTLAEAKCTRSTQSETANDNDNMGTGNYNIAPNQQQHGPSSSNPRHQQTPAATDDFFNFPEMDCLIQNFQGSSAAGTMAMMIGNPNPPTATGGFRHFDAPAVYRDQKYATGETRSSRNWDSETAENFGAADASEARGH